MEAIAARSVAGRRVRAHSATPAAKPQKPAKQQKVSLSGKLKKAKSQLAFRYRTTDTPMSVTRATAQALAEALGVDETQMVHIAIRKLAMETLPQYQADDGALTATQIDAIKQVVPQGAKKSTRSSLFGAVTA